MGETASSALQRGDWIGVCIAMVIIAGVIGAVMWRAYHNERQRTDMTRDAIAQNTNAMVQLCFEIKSSNELSKMTTEKLLEALLKR